MKKRENVTKEFKTLNTKFLVVDELYQREVDMKRVNRIKKSYDACLVNPVKVSFRDNKYYVFDGRHTTMVEKLVRAKGKDVFVDCIVFSGLSRLDEMELFVEQNGESKNVNINDKMRALFNFGDADVCGMVSAAQEAGVRVDFTRGQAVDKVTALRALMTVYLKMQREQFVDMLSVLRQSWDGIPDSFVREILLGAEKFYEAYYGEFKSKDLVSSLRRVTPMAILREGKGLNTGTTSNSTYARLILRAYNNRRKNKLVDKL